MFMPIAFTGERERLADLAETPGEVDPAVRRARGSAAAVALLLSSAAIVVVCRDLASFRPPAGPMDQQGPKEGNTDLGAVVGLVTLRDGVNSSLLGSSSLVETLPAEDPCHPECELGDIPQEATSRDGTDRKGSFLVIGDWGWDWKIHGNCFDNGCQKAIAALMHKTMLELGDVKFVVNVGDSFYPSGVTSKDDPQWQEKWRDIYSKELRSVPWYSTYGNHDLHGDPCACTNNSEECAQVNLNSSDRHFFYMPHYTYTAEHPNLDLEVISMDMNHYDWGFIKDRNLSSTDKISRDCVQGPCQKQCESNMEKRAKDSLKLFYDRMENSNAKNLVVFSHYPTDYFWSNTKFLSALRDNSKHHIEYFGGHRHSVEKDSVEDISPNSNWLVGGGGGWGCEEYPSAARQGIVVGEIRDSGLTTYAALLPQGICCPEAPFPERP